jgi:DNA replication and repair protein RecF
MKLISLEMTDFRNYGQTHINFDFHKNFIVGNNAQGKSNILEAIYLSCLSKSFRTSREKEAIAFSKQNFLIKAEFKFDNENKQKVILLCSHNNGKEISINRKRISRISEFIGNFPVVLSSPDEYNLTTGPPPERRKFIDILLSQISKKYIHFLIEYFRILKQKNAILLNWKLTGKQNQTELEPWNERLVQIGSKIIDFRNKFLQQLSINIRDIYSKLVLNDEQLDFTYQPNVEFNSSEEIEQCFATKLLQISNKELQRGTSLAGPHRDDFIFKINGHDLKKFGSRGQHKTVLISLAAAEYELIKNLTEETPILLIDDLYSELDKNRENNILNLIEGFGQVFITSTEIHNQDSNKEKSKQFFVKSGTIQPM